MYRECGVIEYMVSVVRQPTGLSWLAGDLEQWRTVGGFGGFNPPPEIPKALQNRAKFNPIVKTVKNC